ncbi:MinD/ParA family protein [Anaerobacillus isosaccharinicus]|uniref:Cobyrinic acid a,c-diamide synthase n=1 Tax=Anaerobacillus isosaccharinicus TaxID=1532552 RepID=A0A1S2L6J6_9BACI|nr:MinD/ParA family protein [Anaerobacillus isosaccharinicus]MBA5587317.1 MinD/ParA family protein [Anaerobacillus isosaccharinicus]QOY34490.1 MinD/ParA family protein [Anaerobacillus isosaccharinicus]
MNDQAKNLRQMLNKVSDTNKNAKVIAVVSGKGGVGKSNFSLNFAIDLNKSGKKVILFDLDIGMANVDILMGISAKFTVLDMIEKELSIWDIIEEGPEQLSFIAGGTSFSSIFQLNPRKLSRFLQQLEMISTSFDYIIFDMGAGVSKDSLHFILSANEVIVVTTPEPTSVTDAYAMVKYLQLKDQDIMIKILVNRADSLTEGQKTFENLKLVTSQFLQKEISLLGIIPNDQVVLKAVKAQKPFVLYAPTSKPSQAIKGIVNSLNGVIENEATISPSSDFFKKIKKYFSEK